MPSNNDSQSSTQLPLNFNIEMSDMKRVFYCLFRCRLVSHIFLIFVIFAALFTTLLFTSETLSDHIKLISSALFLTALIVLLFTSRLIWINYIKPIHELETWSQKLRSGELNYKMPVPKYGELTSVSEDLNDLGTMLNHLAKDTDKQLQEHTQYTEQKTQSLTILYDIAASINTSNDLNDLLKRFLNTLTQILNAQAGAVRLLNSNKQMELVASLGFDDDLIEKEKIIPADSCICGLSEVTDTVTFLENLLPCGERVGHKFFTDNISLLVVPLKYQGKTLGVYNLFVNSSQDIRTHDYIELFTSIGNHLGMAIAKARLDEESNNLSIIKERNRISYELHDSLAQTLASIRFQVRVLDEILHQDDEASTWQQLEKIESTVDEANSELRGLIAHFQAPIRKQALVPAVKDIVKRFRAESDIHIFFQYTLVESLTLDDEKHLEVTRIMQEALTNIRKHSHASVARIMMQVKNNNHLNILIEDDGVGIPDTMEKAKPGTQIGLTSMKDRAKRIKATLTFEAEADEGTQLILDVNLTSQSTQQSVNIDTTFQLTNL
ncbi:MAG: GAF domain-containing protein [Gammaproteobacteria bacterium]|nr:GAF domain-containing protein [Gammaproteobacteria bacterium]